MRFTISVAEEPSTISLNSYFLIRPGAPGRFFNSSSSTRPVLPKQTFGSRFLLGCMQCCHPNCASRHPCPKAVFRNLIGCPALTRLVRRWHLSLIRRARRGRFINLIYQLINTIMLNKDMTFRERANQLTRVAKELIIMADERNISHLDELSLIVASEAGQMQRASSRFVTRQKARG